MASHNYWLKRASLQDSLMRATEDETIKRINDQLAILEDDLVKEIHTFYSRYAQDNRMTQADAMKYLTDDELKEFQNVNLARFREMALDPKTDPALLDALSYRHRISRKQAMIHEIQRKTSEVYSSSGAISATVGQGLASGYIKTAAQAGKDMAEAGILSIKPAIKLNDDLILRRMSSKWSGKEFSSRVWTQGQEHFNSIRETLDKAFTGGWSLDKTVLELRKRTGVARHNAERLVRTEMTAYNTMANYDMYKALGAKTYKIEAILDSKTSSICRHQNNKVYLMDDFAPGTTAPPFHVHCRSKIIPTTPEEESQFLESHGYGSPDDSSSDIDQDDQSTSGRKPTLDEVLQIYVDQARELSEKYGLQTVEQVQAIRNAPQVTHKRTILLKGEDVKQIKRVLSSASQHNDKEPILPTEKLKDDIQRAFEKLNEGARLTREEIRRLFDKKYLVGAFPDLANIGALRGTRIVIEDHNLAYILDAHGGQFSLEELLSLPDIVSKPHIVATDPAGHADAYAMVKLLSENRYADIVTENKGDHTLIHFNIRNAKKGKKRIAKIKNNGHILYKKMPKWYNDGEER